LDFFAILCFTGFVAFSIWGVAFSVGGSVSGVLGFELDFSCLLIFSGSGVMGFSDFSVVFPELGFAFSCFATIGVGTFIWVFFFGGFSFSFISFLGFGCWINGFTFR